MEINSDLSSPEATAYYDSMKNNQLAYWVTGIKAKKGTADYQKTYNAMQKDVNDYVKKLQQKDKQIQNQLSNPITERDFRSLVWDSRESYLGSQFYSQLGNGPSERALAEARDMTRRGATRNINKKLSEASFYFIEGYNPQAWNQLIINQDRNRKNALRQSAGLRASGNSSTSTNTQTADDFFGSTNPALYSSKSLMGTNVRATSTDPATAKANAEQTAYVGALRSGGVGLAEALLNPQTAQTFFVDGKQVPKSETSINLETFLTERGYDINDPQSIPDSVLKVAEKQTTARAQARKAQAQNLEMGDLRELANFSTKNADGTFSFNYPKESKEVIAERTRIRNSFLPEWVNQETVTQDEEFFGPIRPQPGNIENFSLLPTGTIERAMAINSPLVSGQPTPPGRKTFSDVYNPAELFFGEFIQGSANTFNSYGNMITNFGLGIQGKELQPLARPPIQDSFFGALSDSAKNTIYGDETRIKENRAQDPLGDFFNTQSKRPTATIAGELFTEALFWALPVTPAVKGAKAVASFFKAGTSTVKATKASKAWTSNADFMKAEGATKSISITDQLGSFFGTPTKTTKPATKTTKPQSIFTSTSLSLGTGTTKGKGGTKGNDFFGGGSSGSGSKGGSSGSGNGGGFLQVKSGNQVLLVKTKPALKTTQKQAQQFFKSYPKTLGTGKAKVITKQKQIPKTAQQFFKPITKQKQILKPLQKTKQKQTTATAFIKPLQAKAQAEEIKVNQKQAQRFFTTKLQTTKQKQKTSTSTRLISPFFPIPPRTSGGIPPLPPYLRFGGGLAFGERRGLRRGRKSFTAWNVNPNRVLGFLSGPEYKKSFGTGIFGELDRRTAKANKKRRKKDNFENFFNI
jgi:hypothetical protein